MKTRSDLVLHVVILLVVLAAAVSAQATAAPGVVAGDVDGNGSATVRDGVLGLRPDLVPAPDGLALDCDRDGLVTEADGDCILNRILHLPPELALFVNPGDPLALGAINPDGTEMQVLGERTADGELAAVKSVETVGTGGKLTEATLDEASLMASLTSSSGGTSKFSWTSPTTLVASSTTADGSAQTIVTVDLEATGKLPAAARLPGPPRGPSSLPPCLTTRDGAPVADPDPPPEALAVPSLAALATLPAANQVALDLTRCGAWVDSANTRLVVTAASGAAWTTPGTPAGEGRYVFTLPSPPSGTMVTPEAACLSAVRAMETACAALAAGLAPTRQDVCAAIAAGFTAAGRADDAAALFADCAEGIGALQLACEAASFSATGEPPSLLEEQCALLGEGGLDRFTDEDLMLVARVTLPGLGTQETVPIVVSARGPFPVLALDIAGSVAILDTTTMPFDPQPFEDYVVSARISCAAPSSKVAVSVAGSDGHASTQRFSANGDVLVQVCVPGRASGVVDRVTVAVEGGPARTIAIVF